MRLARIDFGDGPCWAQVDDDGHGASRLRGGPAQWAGDVMRGVDISAHQTGERVVMKDVVLLPPVERSGQVLCLGGTYSKHIAALNATMADQPAGFWKPNNALVGAVDPIVHPAVTHALDFEVELVVFLGAQLTPGRTKSDCVLGFTVGNDVSLRDLQFRESVTGMDMFSAKSAPRSTPVGPWVTTQDEFGESDPDLHMKLEVNGEVRQSARTSEMEWDLSFLLEWVAQRALLGAGDVIFTGTPEGVGHEDGRYLSPGDVVTSTIARLGTLQNVIESVS